MKKYLRYTLLAAPLAFSSCGEKTEGENSNSQTEEATSKVNFEKKAVAAIKPDVSKFTANLMLDTPAYLTFTGPKYSHQYNADAGMIMTDITWTWEAKGDLYKEESQLTTDKGLVKVIQHATKPEVVGEHIAKAICDVNAETGEVSFRRINSTRGSFSLSGRTLSELGYPKKNFNNAVVVGTDEHMAAVKAAKALQDAKAEEARIAKLEDEKKRHKEHTEKVERYRKVLSVNSVFGGVFPRSLGDRRGHAVTFNLTSIEQKAGRTYFNANFVSKDERGKSWSCKISGFVSPEGNLLLDTVTPSATIYSNNGPEYFDERDIKYVIRLSEQNDLIGISIADTRNKSYGPFEFMRK